MFIVYILFSEVIGRYYIGFSADLDDRILRHNQGRSQSTKAGIPWTVVHQESFETRSEAMSREKEIKGWKSAERIRSLISQENIPS